MKCIYVLFLKITLVIPNEKRNASIFAQLSEQVHCGHVGVYGDDVDVWRLLQNALLYLEQSSHPILGVWYFTGRRRSVHFGPSLGVGKLSMSSNLEPKASLSTSQNGQNPYCENLPEKGVLGQGRLKDF